MKSKRVVSAVTAIALSAGIIGGLGMALKGFNSIENTTGITTTDTTSYVSVGELWNSSNKSFNDSNINILYKYLTGNANASYDDVKSLASNSTTSLNIQSNTLASGNGYSAKSSSQDVVVTLGGLKWEVVYLSNNTDGEPTLTLWLSNSTQDAFKSRSKTEGAYYGFLNGGLYSDWSANCSNAYFTINYPTGMYGTSYIRAVTLNNGGNYVSSVSKSGTTAGAIATLSNASKNTNNVFAPFTMEQFGLTDYIVKPTKMSWQRDQISNTYTLGNESLYMPTDNNFASGSTFGSVENMISKAYYSAWGNDNLWLPSEVETGTKSFYGLWRISVNQRKNYNGSTNTSLGSVGQTSDNAYAFSWLRSGNWANAASMYYLSPSGNSVSSLSGASENSYAVRPALHLNLKKIDDSFTYWFDINTNLDGVGHTVEQNYCSFDVYLDNNRVAEQVSDFNGYFAKGVKYEIKNLTLGKDKIYEGTIWGSLTGTITGQTGIELKLRTATWEDYAASSYAGGIGTKTSPYIIKTAEQLGKLAKDSRTSNLLGKYFKLGGNIDLSAHIWNGIGNNSYKFEGNFDGSFYTISNIKTSVDFYTPIYAGLFGYIKNSSISNIILKNGNVVGRSDSGAIAGYIENTIETEVRNCYVDSVDISCVATDSSGAVGGIAGSFGFIIGCVYKNGTLTANHVGGITHGTRRVRDCAVINATLVCHTSNIYVISRETPESSYGECTMNGTATKQMYGDASAWGNWSYHPSLNSGYPIQKTLFHIGGITGSQNVYNYLTGILNFSVI